MALNRLSASQSSDDPEPPVGCPPTMQSVAKRITAGTSQQEALWSGLADSTAHILAEARAGAGKSSSCREGMWRMLERRPGLVIRYTVFNKANATEFARDCPPRVNVGTSHSFGYQALIRAFGSKVEKNKTYLILDETREGRNLPRYLRKSVAVLAGHAKNQALDPVADSQDIHDDLATLALHYDVNTYGRLRVLCQITGEVLKRSAEWVEVVDFDDMLWLPALHKIAFPDCDVLFLDEVQDFNPAQHALVPLMARSGRVCAVGDRFQSINAFRGADIDSVPRLQEQLEGTVLGLADFPLTVTFRCPVSHVEMANRYVPDLQAAAGAPEGEIGEVSSEQALDHYCPDHLVICPTNAPVVSACLKLIARRIPAYVRGRAVGDQLISVLRGLPESRTVADVSRGVEHWRGRELLRLSGMDGTEDVQESVSDRADGLQAILSACQVPGEAEPLIGRLFGDDRREGVVTFSTVHRAKGDEAEHVWLIEAPGREPRQDWERRQQRNLRYVALTRSRHRLMFVEPAR